MSSLKNDRLIKALSQQQVDVTPVWVMRQAGRYLPEYRKTREQAGSFMTLCKTPELACEVTLQPLRRFDLDAAIIFSDILTIPDAMDLGLSFVEGEGPRFSRPVRSEAQINQLVPPDLSRLNYVYDAIRLVKKELDGKVPLIGFCGSPWTLATYMVEGKSKSGFPLIHNMLQKEPLALHQLLDVAAQSVTAHLNAQIEAGVDVVMIFDTWGGILDTDNYQEFSLYYIKQILAGLIRTYNDKTIPNIVFTKKGNQWLELLADIGCQGLGVDWEISLSEARKRVAGKVALQGNMDPSILLQSPDVIRNEVQTILAAYGTGPGHVFNLGHGITPDVPPEHLGVLVDAVHEFSRQYHITDTN